MPAVFGFADESTALILKRKASELTLSPETVEVDDIVGWILRTPADGIEGFADHESTTDGEEVPSELCDSWALVEVAGKVYRKKVLDSEGEPLKILVANMDEEPIPGNTYIRASRVVGGAILIDWAPCG